MSIQIWPWDGTPGKEETASRKKALTRKDELIKRINALAAPGFTFKWGPAPGDPTRFQLVASGSSPKTRFQKYLKEYADDKKQLIAMRLVAGEPRVCEDSYYNAAVDLDDLAAADDIGFKAILMHILAERDFNDNYAKDIVEAADPADNYSDAHKDAREKEVMLFREIFHDPTIVAPPLSFAPKTNTPYVIVYKSKNGYSIVERIERPKDPVATMKVWVVEAAKGGDVRFTVDDYIDKRSGEPAVKPL